MIKLIKYREDYITEFIRNVFGENGEGVVLSHFGWGMVEMFTGLGERENIEKQKAEAARELRAALWAGETVWTPEETLEPPRAGELGRLLAQTRRELERLGVCPVELTALKFWVNAGAVAGGLLTAERLENLAAQGRRGIFLMPGSLVTPLAARRAREENVVLRRGGRRS